MKNLLINASRAALVAAFVSSAAFGATSITNIFTFGDSLTDVGNTSLATGGLRPGPDYYNGRYSNGPVWVETFAGLLQLPAPTTSLTGGRGNAWAGAYTADGGLVPTVQQQANIFLAGGGSFLASDLVVVWGGANDFLLGGQTNPAISIANISTTITSLAGGGAKTFLLLNLPDLGDTPELLSTNNPAAIAGFSNLTSAFNSGLAAAVPGLESSLGINIFLLDVFGIAKELRNNPGSFGFTNTTDSALLTNNVANAGQYIYWDSVHPTARVHDIIAQRAAQLIPEPSTLMIAVVMAGGLLARRTRLTAARS
jgi:outer membrane lipase/esterase